MREPASAWGYRSPGFGPGRLAVSLGMAAVLVAGVALSGTRKVVAPPPRRTLIVLDLAAPPPPAPSPPAPERRPDMPAPHVEAPITPPPVVRVPVPAEAAVSTPESAPVPATAASSPPTTRSAPPAPAVPSPPAMADLGDLSTAMVSARPPGYPLASRRAREEGTVVIAVRLGVDGRVDGVSIERSSGHERLDRAALEAVRRWRWSPTIRGGVAVEVVGLVRIPFVLQS